MEGGFVSRRVGGSWPAPSFSPGCQVLHWASPSCWDPFLDAKGLGGGQDLLKIPADGEARSGTGPVQLWEAGRAGKPPIPGLLGLWEEGLLRPGLQSCSTAR